MECFIFLLTLYFSTRLDPLYDNITGTAMIPQYHMAVLFFTLFSSVYFGYRMYQLFSKDSHKHFYQWCIVLTSLIMSLGAFFPYTLNQHDLYSTLHVACSMFGCISFLILLFIYTRKMSFTHVQLYLKIHWFYDGFLQFFCLLFFFFGRVNGYIEIMFAFLVCGYLFLIRKYNDI